MAKAKTYNPPINQATTNWVERITSLAAAGAKKPAIQKLTPLVKQDIRSVQQGGQAMSGDEAVLSMAAILRGKPVLQKKDEGFNILDLPGDAVSDVVDLTKGVVPGLGKFVTSLPTNIYKTAEVMTKGTSKADTAWLKSHGYEHNDPISALDDPSTWARALRNVAKTPILGVIPGIHTAAGVTTKEGRAQLLEHPVFTALDVLPAAIAAGKIGAGVKLGEAAAVEGSASEAYQAGKPVKGTYRAVVPEDARMVIADKASKVLRAAGLNKEAFQLARGYAISNRRGALDFEDFIKETGLSDDLAKMTPEELDGLYNEATQLKAGELENADHITPEHRAILEKVNRIGQKLAETDPTLARITHNGEEYIYPNGRVANLHRAMGRAAERLGIIKETHEPLIAEKTALETERLGKKVTDAQRLLDNETTRLEKARERVGEAQAAAEKSPRSVNRLNRALAAAEKRGAAVEARKAAVEEAQGAVDNITTSRRVAPHVRRIERATERLANAKSAFEDEFQKTPPASFEPVLRKIALEKGMEAIRVKFADNPEMIESAVRDVQKRGDLSGYLTSQEWSEIRAGVNSTWQALADEGATPIWVHNVEPGRVDAALNTRPLPAGNPRVSQVKSRVFDMTPRISDVGVAMSSAQAELLRLMQSQYFRETYVKQWTQTWEGIRDQLHSTVDDLVAKGKVPRGVDENGALDMALKKDWLEYNPETGRTSIPHLSGTGTASESKVYIPKYIGKTLEDLVKPASDNAFIKAYIKSTNVFRYSIMALSLKHVAHILFGGMAFLAGRGGPEELASLGRAWRMVKDGEMPVELSRGMDTIGVDQLQQTAAGGTMGRLWMSNGNPATQIAKFEELVSNVQRTMAYLGEEGRALKRGFSEADAHEMGLNHAYKTLVDIDGLAPIERNVFRNIFPFYAFMRHTLKYVLTYPIDMPLRAAILSRISDIEQKDWDSGLPQQFQTLFFMGSPDAEGNVSGVEMKQFNPFRDTGSYFSLAGFIQSLNPALGAPFTLSGVDKFTGSPDLYPELTVDPKTGNLVAKRPPNALYNTLQTYIPEAGLVDYFGGLTQDMRDLKKRDPEAYKARLWNMLFLPFEKKTINKGEEVAHLQGNILRIAQQDVSDALKTGNTSKLDQYKAVPYNGELVSPDYLKQLIKIFKKASPNTSPRAVIPRNL